MTTKNPKRLRRAKIQHRVRSKVHGTAERPRLNVFKSSKHIYAQIIDDDKGHTLASASTLTKELADQFKDQPPVEKARIVGRKLGELADQAGIKRVSFDRSGYKYHGKVKALAEGARENGLKF